MSARRRATSLLLLPLLGGGLACADRPSFRLVGHHPGENEGPLRRNEAITLLFDREVDPSSVGAESVRVERADGTPAAGRLEVEGRRVRFVPRPGRTGTWEDGGYGDSDRVAVVLAGFPGRGVLSASGRIPLGEAVRRELSLAPPPDGRPSARSFRDPVPGGPRLARPPAAGAGVFEVPAGAALALHFSEPLFPPIQEPVTLRFDDRDRTRVETSTELVQGERDAVLLVRPADGFREGTRYLLELRPEHLTDLVGSRFDGRGLPREYGVRVIPAAEGGS